MKKADILNTRDTPDALCELVEKLGYKQKGRFAINQLQCSNGAFVSSLIHFFEDNPDAVSAVVDWAADNLSEEETADDFEDDGVCPHHVEWVFHGICQRCGEGDQE